MNPFAFRLAAGASSVFYLVVVALTAWSLVPVSAADRKAVLAPEPRRGAMTLTFTERHPLSGPKDVSRRTGIDFDAQPDRDRKDLWEYDLADESFEVFVPATYKRGVPHGLLVWINLGRAEVPRAWAPILARHKLIWVSANNTPRSRGGAIRKGLALDAVHNMKMRYDLDARRVYVAGYSGGGGVASDLIHGFPDDFAGAYCILGYSFYNGRTGSDGRLEVGTWSVPWEGPPERIRKDVKLVLVDGEGDPQCVPGAALAVAEALRLDGFERVTAFEVPRLGHNLPSPAWFEKGLAALEARYRPGPTTRPTADAKPGPGQIAHAARILVEARCRIDWAKKSGNPAGPWAHKYLRQVIEEYPTTPAAAEARELLMQLNAPDAAAGTNGDDPCTVTQ